MKNKVSRSKRVSFIISILYILISIFWLFASEWTLTNYYILNDYWISIGKGCLFVLVTGFLLYTVIHRNMKDIENQKKQLNSLFENNFDCIIHLDLNGHII